MTNTTYTTVTAALGAPRVLDPFQLEESGDWVVTVALGDALAIRLRATEDAAAYAAAFTEAARRLREVQP